MKTKKDNNLEYGFNGGWTKGEAKHHIGKKNKTKIIDPKNIYKRNQKYKKNFYEDTDLLD